MSEGTSEKDKRLSCRVHTRLSEEKYAELSGLLEQSRSIHSLSELLRNILDNKKIVVQTYDITLDKVTYELGMIRKELHAIGININQITHQFNIYSDFEHRIFLATEAAKQYKQTGVKVEELLSIIAKLSEQWSPK